MKSYKKLTEKKLDEVTRKIIRENINKIKNNGIKEFGFIIMDRKEFNKTIRECLNEMVDSTISSDGEDLNYKWYSNHQEKSEDARRKVEYLKTLGNENTRVEVNKRDHNKIDVIQKVGSVYIIDSSNDKYKIRVFKPFGKNGIQFMDKSQSEYDTYLNDFNQNQDRYAQDEYDIPWNGKNGFWQTEWVNKNELCQGKYKQDCLIYDNIKKQIV